MGPMGVIYLIDFTKYYVSLPGVSLGFVVILYTTCRFFQLYDFTVKFEA